MHVLRTAVRPEVLVYPGHTYHHPPGQSMQFLYRRNIYLMIDTIESFRSFRMRPGQEGLYRFR